MTPRRGLHPFSHHTLLVWCTALWCWGNFCVTTNFLYLWVATKNSVEMTPAPRARPGRHCFLWWQESRQRCVTDAMVTTPYISRNIAHLENKMHIWRQPIPKWPQRKEDLGNFHHFHHTSEAFADPPDYEKREWGTLEPNEAIMDEFTYRNNGWIQRKAAVKWMECLCKYREIHMINVKQAVTGC